MGYCKECNIVHANLDCQLCEVRAQIEQLRKIVKAAPTMLEALKKIVSECPNPKLPYGVAIVEIAQAAIDKAEGRE